jgi:drug/metabolite transporter (DMT)-like permease
LAVASLRKQIYGNLMLLVTAFIWGSTFVSQSASMEYIGPFTFNAFRCLLGGSVLIPVVFVINRKKAKKTSIEKKYTLVGGLLCGVFLFLGSSLQQIGIQYTTVQKTSFISTLYIIIVPIFGLFGRRRLSTFGWAAVALSTVGLYLLCIREDLTINPGDAYIFFSAILYAGHILLIDRFIAHADGVAMSCIQFFVTSCLSAGCMFLFETPVLSDIKMAAGSIVYAGIMSNGVAYTLQIIAQKSSAPAIASLIMSLESVFGALSGWLFLNERVALREGVGMVLMFSAIILSQLPGRRRGLSEGTDPITDV